MDKLILAEKPEALRHCVQRVVARRPDSVEALQCDVDSQDILALNLTRAVQLCVDAAGIVVADSDQPAPQTMGQAFDALAGMQIYRRASSFNNSRLSFGMVRPSA